MTIWRQLRRFSPLIGLGLLCLVLTRVDWADAVAHLTSMDVSALLLCSLAYSVNVFLKALRWHVMVRQLRLNAPLRVTFPAFLAGAFWGMLTIGKLGELFRVEAVLARGASRVPALATCLADRLLDVFFLLLVASLGALSFAVAATGVRVEVVAVGVATLCLGPAFGLRRWLTRHTGRVDLEQSLAWLPDRWRRLATRSAELLFAIARLLVGRGAAISYVLTGVSWLGYFFTVFWLARGLGLDVPFLDMATTTSLAAVTAALPISFQGVGTRDAVFAVLLKSHGISVTQSALLSLTTLALFYVVTIPLGGWGLWVRKRQIARADSAG